VSDAALCEPFAEAAAGEGDPLSVPSVSTSGSVRRAATASSTKSVASSVRHRSSSDQPTISRVQQSIEFSD